MYPTIELQQPHPNDIVGSRVLIAGLATGFEATVRARVRDDNGQQLLSTHFMSGGGTGEIGQFQAEMDLEERPTIATILLVYWLGLHQVDRCFESTARALDLEAGLDLPGDPESD